MDRMASPGNTCTGSVPGTLSVQNSQSRFAIVIASHGDSACSVDDVAAWVWNNTA